MSRHGVLVGAICGLLCGLSAGVRAGPDTILNEAWVYAVSDGVSIGLSFWLLVAILQGVSGATLEEHRRIVPNQGIRLSARNGLFMGIIGACVSGAFAFLAVVLRNVLSDQYHALSSIYVREGLIAALIVGLAGGLISGLLKGWLACIRHSFLRLLLSQAGVIPLDYPDFLDEVAARALLRKVGGSYIFIHQLLLGYFATLGPGLAGSMNPPANAVLSRGGSPPPSHVLPPPSPYLVRSDGAELRLESDVLNLGRAPDNHIVVNDKQVSRHHSVLKREGTGYVLEDVGTPNGTYMNGERIQRRILASGDVIRLGQTEFSYRLLIKNPASGR